MSSSELPQVQYRKLGKTGLRVSVPIIGGMSFGNPAWDQWVLGEEKALLILKAAWDRGLNTIDTANAYSNGDSERIVAKFIKKYEIPRQNIVIMTKCFGIVANTPGLHTGYAGPGLKDTREYVNQGGLSRAAIFNAVEASLIRLGTSYIDVLQIHRFDTEVTAEEIMKALHDLVQAGKVRYIGASSMRTWQFAHLNEVARRNGWTTFVSMQNQYSLLYREEEREMMAYCKFHGIGVIPWFPLHAGRLARPLHSEPTVRTEGRLKSSSHSSALDLTEADQQIVNRVEEIAKKRGWKMAQVALSWAGTKVTSPIVGMNSVERMLDSIVRGMDLTEEEINYLEEPYVPKAIMGHA